MAFWLILALLGSADDFSLFPTRQTAFDSFVSDLAEKSEPMVLKTLPADDPRLLSKGCWIVAVSSDDKPLNRSVMEALVNVQSCGWAVVHLPMKKFPVITKHYSVLLPEILGVMRGEPLDRRVDPRKEHVHQIAQLLVKSWYAPLPSVPQKKLPTLPKREPAVQFETEINLEQPEQSPAYMLRQSKSYPAYMSTMPRISTCPSGQCPSGGCPR